MPQTVTVINFGHPLTEEQAGQLRGQIGEFALLQPPPVHWEVDQPFAPQVQEALEELGLSPEQWQSERIVLSLPTLHVAAAVMLAALHGRIGHFPAIVRLRPVDTPAGTSFELAEVIPLDDVRRNARLCRRPALG